jgi:glutamyl-tRNA synthetase
MTVRTRFAPSPTGFLHIGGVRTALFNYLLARQAGGQFILRIDDTDQQRNVSEALQPILDGFRWLGIEWDEGPDVAGPYGPYYQSQRHGIYQAAVDQLLQSGHAYRDFAKSEELADLRAAAEKQSETWIYDRRWMATSDEQAAEFEKEGREGVVRLKMPREGTCLIKDIVRGDVEFEWAGEQDTVIQRADGSCLYHLASVVDDAAYKITHVVRAVEHLSNTPRQIFIAQSLGYDLPVYAHLPYVAEPGGTAKLSKRKLAKYLKQKDFAELNALGAEIAAKLDVQTSEETFNPVVVDFYRETGFLPSAILNYLLMLGWSLDGQQEDFSLADAIEVFSLDRVNQSPASFNAQKLLAVQARKLSALSVEQRVELTVPFARQKGWVGKPATSEELSRLAAIVAAADTRIKLASDILHFDDFFVAAEVIDYEEKAWEKRVIKDPTAVELVREFREILSSLTPFDTSTVELALKGFLDAKNVKFGAIIHALRLMLTGKSNGFGMMDTMAILGRDACLTRIDQGLARVA